MRGCLWTSLALPYDKNLSRSWHPRIPGRSHGLNAEFGNSWRILIYITTPHCILSEWAGYRRRSQASIAEYGKVALVGDCIAVGNWMDRICQGSPVPFWRGEFWWHMMWWLMGNSGWRVACQDAHTGSHSRKRDRKWVCTDMKVYLLPHDSERDSREWECLHSKPFFHLNHVILVPAASQVRSRATLQIISSSRYICIASKAL